MRHSSLAASFFREYTTLVVLLVLGCALSVATLDWQHPAGATAGRQLAGLLGNLPAGARVLIVAKETREDREFADTLAEQLNEKKIKVQGVHGEPADALRAIQKLAEDKTGIDAIAATSVTADWEVLADLGAKYPPLAAARVVRPASYLWPNFLKASNLLNIANQIAVIAIIAIGMTMVIVAGGIDLSVGSLAAISAVTTAQLIERFGGAAAAPGWSLLVCGLVAMGMCGLIGAGNGAMVALVRIPPFIVTLAFMSIFRGTAFIQSKGESVHQLSPAIKWFGGGADILGIPNAVVLMLVLYLAADVVMKRTTFGRHLYAVGGNSRAAMLCGIPVREVVLLTYVISGVFAGLGGVILASQFQSGSPNYGKDYELSVIASVVVGGTSLAGGQGKMFGTLLGALIIAVVQNGMNLRGLSGPWQQVVLGAVILLAALLDRLKQAGGRE